MDGLLEQPKPHETDSIPSKFPRVYFDEDGADGTVTDKEVSNDKSWPMDPVPIPVMYMKPFTLMVWKVSPQPYWLIAETSDRKSQR